MYTSCVCVYMHAQGQWGEEGSFKRNLRKLQNILRRHRSHSMDLMRKLHHTVDLVLTPVWKLNGAPIHELGGQLGTWESAAILGLLPPGVCGRATEQNAPKYATLNIHYCELKSIEKQQI